MSEEIDDISQDALTFIGLVAAEKLKKPGADTLFEIVTRQGKTHTFTSMEHHHGDLVVIEGGLGNGYPVQQGGPNPRLWIRCSEIMSFQVWCPNPDYLTHQQINQGLQNLQPNPLWPHVPTSLPGPTY
jgi:hypothetical protein